MAPLSDWLVGWEKNQHVESIWKKNEMPNFIITIETISLHITTIMCMHIYIYIIVANSELFDHRCVLDPFIKEPEPIEFWWLLSRTNPWFDITIDKMMISNQIDSLLISHQTRMHFDLKLKQFQHRAALIQEQSIRYLHFTFKILPEVKFQNQDKTKSIYVYPFLLLFNWCCSCDWMGEVNSTFLPIPFPLVGKYNQNPYWICCHFVCYWY